ncbi:MAG: 5-(carboxyamino)imidazole ribonucleotide mutase [Tissierellia bacterium]|nr:5-(carboxyamino)imidazole ribonucleotide mutase [Tissierellia bacterium]
MKVAIIIGSVSDYEKIKPACDYLKDLEIEYDLRALSAHRNANDLENYIEENDKDIAIYIAAAGKAAHLPGVVASKTIKPVIGVPIMSTALEGMDALLSIVQMPPGIPVATVAINGAKNAAILACQIMANNDKKLYEKLFEDRKNSAEENLKKEKELLDSLQ